MNVLLWLVAGAVIGFVAFAVLHLNLDGGAVISIAIGMLTAVFGGHILAPVFGAPIGEGGEFSVFALLVAAATALGALSIGDITSKRVTL